MYKTKSTFFFFLVHPQWGGNVKGTLDMRWQVGNGVILLWWNLMPWSFLNLQNMFISQSNKITFEEMLANTWTFAFRFYNSWQFLMSHHEMLLRLLLMSLFLHLTNSDLHHSHPWDLTRVRSSNLLAQRRTLFGWFPLFKQKKLLL